MAEHFRLVFNIIYSYIICIQKHIYMYNLNFYIFSISHPLWTDDIFFWATECDVLWIPQESRLQRGQDEHVVKSGWSGQRDDARATAECPAGHDTNWCFLQVMGVSPSSLDGLYWFMENPFQHIPWRIRLVLLYMVCHGSHQQKPQSC